MRNNEQKKPTISIRLHRIILDKIKDKANEENRTVNNMIECIIIKGLEN